MPTYSTNPVLTFLYRCSSVATLPISAPRAGVPFLDNLHIITIRVIRSLFLSFFSFLFSWKERRVDRFSKRNGNKELFESWIKCAVCGMRRWNLLFHLLIFRCQTHRGFLRFWCDELIHAIFVKETLQENEVVSGECDRLIKVLCCLKAN